MKTPRMNPGFPLCLLVFLSAGRLSADWPQFRGPNGQGRSDQKEDPIHWDETKNVAWKTAVPGQGFSSPVVARNQVWMTSAEAGGRSLHAICIDQTNGRLLYNVEVLVAAWNKMGEPSLRPSFPSFEKLVEKHDRNHDDRIARDEFPTLWIFHRPDGAEAPMNGGTVGFDFAHKDKNRGITADEWSTIHCYTSHDPDM